MEILHLNCGLLKTDLAQACCHCLAIVDGERVALVDTGIGLLDVLQPDDRLGRALIDSAGFRFDERRTALRQLQARGIAAHRVTDIVLTHADPDHTGGLADFPDALVHVAAEERAAVVAGHPRYRLPHFDHGPRWVEHGPSQNEWQGLRARPITVCGGVDILLVELFGHTAGHCGVVLRTSDGWLLHAGDAYYLRVEFDDPQHPVCAMAEAAAIDNARRLESLDQLRRLRDTLGGSLAMIGYHDESELSTVMDQTPTLQ